MGDTHRWREQQKCNKLSVEEADKLFFPGKGGKINKAEEFCKDCPVLSTCFAEAIRDDLYGFYAGTTRQQRRDMAKMMGVLLAPPAEEVKKRKVFRKITVAPDVHEWLDTVDGPTEEDLSVA